MIHGAYLAAERWLKQAAGRRTFLNGAACKLLLALVTYTLVNVAWVFFRAKTLPAAVAMLGAMAGLHAHAAAVLPTVKILETAVCLAGLLSAQLYMRDRSLEDVVTQASPRLVTAAWACMAFAIIITQGAGSAFIYFQF